jgi:segregation and condensation protein A
MHSIKLEQFEGPLDLLLQLIEQEELDITTVSLAKVTDQYLKHIEQLEHVMPEEVADFLLVASKLIYLKSKYLLPNLDIVDEEDAGDLAHQLKMYQQFYQASKVLEKMLGKQHFGFIRTQPMRPKFAPEFTPPPSVTAEDFPAIMRTIIGRLTEIARLPKVLMARAVSIKERISHFRELLQEKMEFSFSRFIDKENKVDTIVSFLAMLELVKQRIISVDQSELFADISIRSQPLIEPKLNE